MLKAANGLKMNYGNVYSRAYHKADSCRDEQGRDDKLWINVVCVQAAFQSRAAVAEGLEF